MMQGQTPCRVATFNRSQTDPIGVITIKQADNVVGLALQIVLGPVVIQGSASFPNTFGGVPIPSQQIRFVTGDSFTIVTGNQQPIDGLFIDCTEGSANFVLKM